MKYIIQPLYGKGIRYEWMAAVHHAHCINQRNADMTQREAHQFALMIREKKDREDVGNVSFIIEQ